MQARTVTCEHNSQMWAHFSNFNTVPVELSCNMRMLRQEVYGGERRADNTMAVSRELDDFDRLGLLAPTQMPIGAHTIIPPWITLVKMTNLCGFSFLAEPISAQKPMGTNMHHFPWLLPWLKMANMLD